jgi:hypothetical protein
MRVLLFAAAPMLAEASVFSATEAATGTPLLYGSATMPNSGTPAGVPADVDCAVRALAWEYGKHLLPERGEFRSLFEAMQLQFCNMTTPTAHDKWEPPRLPTPHGTTFYVSTSGDDKADGSKAHPFATLARGVSASAGTNATVLMRGGTYYLAAPIELGPHHSGLTIQNYDGEHVTLSGGVPLSITRPAWALHKRRVEWETHPGTNNVYGQASPRADSEGIVYLGTMSTTAECEAAAKKDAQRRGPFTQWTFHTPKFGGDFAGQCFGRTDDAWAPVPQANVDSGLFVKQNVWVAELGEVAGGMPGLRVDGKRAIRAKYPNGDPEQSGSFLRGANQGMGGGDYVKGWIPLAANTEWVPPARKPDSREIVITADDWPDVEWPMKEAGGSSWTGEGDWGEFHIGTGGYCDDLTPPAGYWCAMHPPRGQCWDEKTNVGSGCVQTHMSPDGMALPRAANYSHPEDAVIQSWRGGGRWFTQQWQATHYDTDKQRLMFDPSSGMQGGEGMTSSGQWWVENVLEECDDAREYFYDARAGKLYYNPNSTDAGPSGGEAWVATSLRTLFNLTGTASHPVRDVTIAGLTMRDTRHTFLDAHGMPTGGDWALQRVGAITAEGTEGLRLSQNELTNLDGVGVSLNGYHRHAAIEANELSWIGDTAIVAWGHTSTCLNANCTKTTPYKVGPDARGGEQPRFTSVSRNLVRELGLYQKQSSFYFQAATSESSLVDNVHFNGPRAGVNFNDGMGGGDEMKGNLIANCVRESGDHGDRRRALLRRGWARPAY